MQRIALLLPLFCILHAHAIQLFIGTAQSDGIYTSHLNPSTGELTPFKCAAKIKRPSFITIDAHRKKLYSTNLQTFNQSGEIIAFQIKKDSTLTELNRMPSQGINPCHLQLAPNQNVLFTANYGAPNRPLNTGQKSTSITSYRIQPNGHLTAPISSHAHTGSGTHPTRQKEPHAHSVFPHPTDPYVYVADLGADAIFSYHYHPKTATLTPLEKIVVPGGNRGPRHMKWAPNGKTLYLLNELSLTLSVFTYTGEGQLNQIDQIDVLPPNTDRHQLTAAEIRLHPTKPLIYVSIRDKADTGRDSITLFHTSTTQTTRIKTIPAHVAFPRNFNIDPTGKWLLIAGQRSNNIAIFSLNPDGIPDALCHHYPFPGEPICIEFLDE
jgi:6-phosphogluconolactonase